MHPCSHKLIAARDHSLTGHNLLHHLIKQVDLSVFGPRNNDTGMLLTVFSVMTARAG